MNSKVYVVVQSCDCRDSDHDVKVHGCFSDKKDAKIVMRQKAQEELGRRNPQYWKLDNGDDFSQVRSGETFIIFEFLETNFFP